MIPEQWIGFAHELADTARQILIPYFRTPFLTEKKRDFSPVTEVDCKVEEVLWEKIHRHFPDHGMIGEEYGGYQEEHEYVWVVDPIDGTKSFITGKPLFGTLIALLYRSKPVLGIMDQAITKERWIGVYGKESELNGKTIKTRASVTLAEAIMATTSPDLFSAEEKGRFEQVKSRLYYCDYGGDSYNYALLASGFIDVVIEAGLKLYDIAALIPIIEGAGGVVTDWQGHPITPGFTGQVLAASTLDLHSHLIKILK